MSTLHRWLVIRADGSGRVLSKERVLHLRWDEIAFDLTIKMPNTWKTVVGKAEITVPDPSPAALEVGAAVVKEAGEEEPRDGTDE